MYIYITIAARRAVTVRYARRRHAVIDLSRALLVAEDFSLSLAILLLTLLTLLLLLERPVCIAVRFHAVLCPRNAGRLAMAYAGISCTSTVLLIRSRRTPVL